MDRLRHGSRRLHRGEMPSVQFQKLRAAIVADLIGKNPTNVKLRPSGRVALEWARLFTEEPVSNPTEY